MSWRRGRYMTWATVTGSRWGTALLVPALLSLPGGAEAQQLSYARGQPLFPAFEGWVENADGSTSLLFGYMNENWEQTFDIPVGDENSFSPGPADRGQPTHFMPRRNRFVFAVPVPADFGDRELRWTVRANGQEFNAYGSLAPDYFLENVTIMSETGALGGGASTPAIRANEPPVIELEGDLELRAQVGETLTLVAKVTDDGQPPARRFLRRGVQGDRPPSPDDEPPTARERFQTALTLATGRGTVGKANGLHFTWFVYRGAAEAVFDPPQTKPWEDTRPFANSPWSAAWVPPALRQPSELPDDGRWVSEVTFQEPGTYVLRGRADDGGLYSDVEVTIRVTRPSVD